MGTGPIGTVATRRLGLSLVAWLVFACLSSGLHCAEPAGPIRDRNPAFAACLPGRGIELRCQASGAFSIVDTLGGVAWSSNPARNRFGSMTWRQDGKTHTAELKDPRFRFSQGVLSAEFRPRPDQPEACLTVTFAWQGSGRVLDLNCSADPALDLDSVRLLDEALWVGATDPGYALVPVREGLMIPADSGLAFTQSFDTYAYEGCHMTMLGLSKHGALALVTWTDPYVRVELRSALADANPALGVQALFPSLVLRRSARSLQIHFPGRGDHNSLGRTYRQLAEERGWRVPWRDKLHDHPERARLFGAVNFKLWSALDRTMDEASQREERVQVNWTFPQAARIADHLQQDLGLNRVLFLMGGWIHRGYDNQHPDVLPAAPECGGNEALAACARHVQSLGYLFGLHDNYQDMYRDAPSWNEDDLTRLPDGRIAQGGKWAGGRAYLTCSSKAVELALRPQNLPAVAQLTGADAYFIDTTYAAGLMECADPRHPLTRLDDLRWKQVLSDVARTRFSIFGSECGREWAIPHSDFFEGLTGVGGAAYHDAELLRRTGGRVVPLFEMVYRDCIAMYGKYGYDVNRAADYVLQHLLFGRPLHYHDVPPGLYWEANAAGALPHLPIQPAAPAFEQTGPREISLGYQWTVRAPPTGNWQVFVHFTDAAGTIYQQTDHAPDLPTSEWLPGRMESARFTVTLSDRLRGTLDIRVGLWDPATGKRAQLEGPDDGEGRYRVARLRIGTDRIELLPPDRLGRAGNASVFASGDGGWSAGMHPLDRFIKNTYEILSPLNALTADQSLTRHEFLTSDGHVQRSRFGDGPAATIVTVNFGPADYPTRTRLGGEVRLPPHGFTVESPTFIAFHAGSWNGLHYEWPPLFTLRSLDGQPLDRSGAVRVFHGFGDARLAWGTRGILTIEKERTLGKLGP